MPREIITIQVGQCGNQVAMRFWDLALREYKVYHQKGVFTDSLSSFFTNIEGSEGNFKELGTGEEIKTLRARSVVVDMEEGVINNMLRSDIGSLFDSNQIVSSISGAGNCWAHGHFEYGKIYGHEILETIRKKAEECHSLQSYILMHSMGGGTGSGLGTYILTLLHDNYPEVFKFNAVVFPEDDVVTGPYNSVLAMSKLTEFSDCVLPVDNRALRTILDLIDMEKKKKQNFSDILDTGDEKTQAFAKMNNVIAHLLNNLTCSMRYEGMLNVDLNEITMNLVPFPGMPYLVSSLSPLYSIIESKKNSQGLDQLFDDVIDNRYQLMHASPIENSYLACALLLRGNVRISDVTSNIDRIKPKMKTTYWSDDSFKIGLCNEPPIGMDSSLLCLANNTCIRTPFQKLRNRFMKLYKRKANVHHYTEYMEIDEFDSACLSLDNLIERYTDCDTPKHDVRRISPLI
jgi:tubulin epsilon